MYQSSYAEVLADSTTAARHDERRALDHAIQLLQRAKPTAINSDEEKEALSFVAQLWAFFIKNLADSDNDLPDQLRADLMSVGLGVISEVCRIEAGHSRDFDGVADICGIVRDGLGA